MIINAATAFYLVCAGLLLGGTNVADDPYTNAVELQRFSFEFDDDKNYDNQPDEWTRRRGKAFPPYVIAAVDRSIGAHGRQSLRFDVNGAQAVYYSPLIRVDQAYSYIMRGQIRTEGLRHDAAIISLSLLDHKRRRIRRFLSQPVTGTNLDWVSVGIGPVRIDPEVCFIVLGCHVAEGEKSDIQGKIWFDDLWLGSLPRLELSTDSGHHFFRADESICIVADVRGLAPQWDYHLLMQLQDGAGQVLDRKDISLEAAADEKAPKRPEKQFRWNLSQQMNGFYRVRATLEHDQKRVQERETTFVIMDLAEPQPEGEFGWSVTAGAGEMGLDQLAEVASQSGINWLKYPMWSVTASPDKTDLSELNLFLDHMDRQNITLVGLLNDPPAKLTDKFASTWVGISRIFTMPRNFWYPSLEPLIARYSFRIRHWQLGDETDDSFIGLQSLPQTIAAVKKEFDRIGHDSRLGCHWDWNHEFPRADEIRHSFLSINNREPLNVEQLQAALQKTEKAGIPRWVLLKPLAKSQHSATDRANDLARRLVAAKLGKADAIFVSNPLDEEHGLLHADGSPAELFLPWRTLAVDLQGSTYLGRFEMPAHSPNAVFSRRGEVILVLWNDQPCREEMYLGERVIIRDLWGGKQQAEVNPRTGAQIIPVGPTPIVVSGCSEAVARWRLAVQFEFGKIRSEYGGHEEAILGENTFPQGISGRVTLHMPQDWEVEPSHWTIQAGAKEKLRLTTLLTFPPDASLGKLRPSIDFEISADRPYKFTVYLPYQLGLGDVELEVTGRKTAEGRLEIEQKIKNNTSPLEVLNFNCSLFIPGQIRQKQIVTKLGQGEDKRFYYAPYSESLRGKEFWMRAEQIDGRRILNYRFKIAE